MWALLTTLCQAILPTTRDQALALTTKIINTGVAFYKPSTDGAVAQSLADGYGTPWFESAIMWESVMRNIAISHNEQNIQLTVAAIVNSSFGIEASFLGPPELHQISSTLVGKWVN